MLFLLTIFFPNIPIFIFGLTTRKLYKYHYTFGNILSLHYINKNIKIEIKFHDWPSYALMELIEWTAYLVGKIYR